MKKIILLFTFVFCFTLINVSALTIDNVNVVPNNLSKESLATKKALLFQNSTVTALLNNNNNKYILIYNQDGLLYGGPSKKNALFIILPNHTYYPDNNLILSHSKEYGFSAPVNNFQGSLYYIDENNNCGNLYNSSLVLFSPNTLNYFGNLIVEKSNFDLILGQNNANEDLTLNFVSGGSLKSGEVVGYKPPPKSYMINSIYDLSKILLGTVPVEFEFLYLFISYLLSVLFILILLSPLILFRKILR